MQVLPLLTPKNFNSKKRSRSEDDFESNYLKKRLILSPPAQFYHATKGNNKKPNKKIKG